jgi:thiamine transporter ThiT
LAALLAALSGFLSRLLGLLPGLLLAALSGLLVRLLGLLPALIWIILSHSYLQFLGRVLLEYHYSNNRLHVSHVAAEARDVEKET